MVKCKQYVSKHIFKNTHGNANAHSKLIKLMTLLRWVALVLFEYQMQTNYSYRSSYTIHFQSAFFWLNLANWLIFFKMDTNFFFSVLLAKFQQFLFENLPDFSIGSNM
jgi:hypothetical protein